MAHRHEFVGRFWFGDKGPHSRRRQPTPDLAEASFRKAVGDPRDIDGCGGPDPGPTSLGDLDPVGSGWSAGELAFQDYLRTVAPPDWTTAVAGFHAAVRAEADLRTERGGLQQLLDDHSALIAGVTAAQDQV